MNTLELLGLLNENITFFAFEQIREDLFKNYRDELKKLRFNKSATEAATKKYIAGASYKDNSTAGLYSDGVSIIYAAPGVDNSELKTVDIKKFFIEAFKNARPVDCHIIESLAMYKTLYKQNSDLEYLLNIDGNYYNPKLILKVLPVAISNKTNYTRLDAASNGALMIEGRAVILPVKLNGASDISIEKNINISDINKWLNNYEQNIIERIKATA